MFSAHNINSNTLSIKNLILLFLTIVLGFASVITLAQISIPSTIENARQTIAKISITESGMDTTALIEMSSGGIYINTGILYEQPTFSGKVLGIDDNGNVIYVLSENLVTSGGGGGGLGGDGLWTGVGSDIWNINAGNVGINTQTMSGKLHITSSGETELYLQELSGGSAANINFQSPSATTWALGGDSNPDIFYIGLPNGPIYFSVKPTGNVGIGSGNINPKANLQVIGTFIAGYINNNISGDYSSIGGGRSAGITGNYSSIGGGMGNKLVGDNSFIGGGGYNNIFGGSLFVGGGYGNNIHGIMSAIGGGRSNIITGNQSFIGGGQENNITGNWSFIGGGGGTPGNGNSIIGNNSAIVVGGGKSNKIINADNAFIGAGGSNEITLGTNSNIVGGATNIIDGAEYSSIVGGDSNRIIGNIYSAIVGGFSNKIYSTENGFIGGGEGNIISGSSTDSTIVGGNNNKIYSTEKGFIGGGMGNNISGSSTYSNIVGGYNNHIYSTEKGFIGGGMGNNISGSSTYSFIGGGQNNKIQNAINSFAGGYKAYAYNDNSFVRNSDPAGTGFQTTTSGQFLINAPYIDTKPGKGGVGINVNNPQTELDIEGLIRIREISPLRLCDGNIQGAIQFSGEHFYGCAGTGWKQLDN